MEMLAIIVDPPSVKCPACDHLNTIKPIVETTHLAKEDYRTTVSGRIINCESCGAAIQILRKCEELKDIKAEACFMCRSNEHIEIVVRRLQQIRQTSYTFFVECICTWWLCRISRVLIRLFGGIKRVKITVGAFGNEAHIEFGHGDTGKQAPV